MNITKYVHACLLVESDGRTALFDPGVMSADALDIASIESLDDILITHGHPDHCDPKLIAALVAKFPQVRITAPQEVVTKLQADNIVAGIDQPDGVIIFNAPHEPVEPMFPLPEENGYHYLNVLTHPGDSHSFAETKAIMALPVSGPWASTVKALNLALELKPQHIIPVHDWHWHDQARDQTYANLERALGEQGITFHKPETGQPISIDV